MQYGYFCNTLNLIKSKNNFKDPEYDNYRNEKKIDNNDKSLFDSKIISGINNGSLDDKSEISFNNDSITYQLTQNDKIKLNNWAEINYSLMNFWFHYGEIID